MGVGWAWTEAPETESDETSLNCGFWILCVSDGNADYYTYSMDPSRGSFLKLAVEGDVREVEL